jgi:DNA-binding PadR family transcriptional regulator
MIELLILYELNTKVLTMYGVSKFIKNSFSVLTTPSYGTIKPALNRLERAGFVKIQKNITKGGRPSTYYSITKNGVEELKRLILSPPLENPIQFLTTSRVKLYCADVLEPSSQKELLKQLKLKAESIVLDTQKLLEARSDNFYPKMVFDNLICEYKNFISLLEGFEHACKN